MTRLFGTAMGWCFVVFCANAADPLATWHLRNPLTTANQIYDITYGNGRYVAVGEAGTIIMSEDVIHWRRVNAAVSEHLYAVAHGNGHFVAAGQNGRVLTSVDGEQWLSFSLGTNVLLNDLCFGQGKFVAVASSPGVGASVWVSADATTWSKTFDSGTNSSLPSSLRAITFGNGRFVAAGGPGMASSDGTNWVSNYNYSAADIAYGNGRFVTLGSHGDYLQVSPDGITWEELPGLRQSVPRITFGNGFFVFANWFGASAANKVFTTTDGLNLTLRTNGVGGAMCFDGSRFVGVSDSAAWQSSDGVHWRQTSRAVGQSLRTIHAQVSDGYGTLFLGEISATNRAAPNHLWTTTGLTWTEGGSLQFGTVDPIDDAVFANGKFVAVSGAGTILLSTNAMDWSNPPSGTTASLWNVCTARGIFYVRQESGRMIVSSDGVSWVPAEFDAVISDVADNGERLVAVNGTNVITSLNGVDWVTNAFVSPRFLQGVVYGNGQFVAIGLQGLIATSADGIDWSLIDSGTEAHLNAIAFGDGMFVIVGNTGTILTSADGTNWMGQVAGISASLRNVTWNGKTFITSGDDRVILESDPLIATAPFIIRHPPLIVAHSGTELSLDVIASGSSPLGYQWFRNFVAVDAATNAYLHRRFVSPADAGDYFVIVSNFAGSVTSLIANVSVITNIGPPALRLRRGAYTELEVVGTPGAEHVVEYAPVLGDSNAWHTLRTLIPLTEVTTVPDVTSTNVPSRFYRTVIR